VIIVDGVAHLWGTIQSEEEEKALCIAASEVKGVKHVQAHLAFAPVTPLM
jgi:osmotically-inducible protein OsmY